jgi:hypothetical protein
MTLGYIAQARTKDKGQRTKDKGQRIKDKGQRIKFSLGFL